MPNAVKQWLDELYLRFNRRDFVHPDPLEFLYPYEDLRDRELVGLVASSLAYGRVSQILRSIASVLERMEPSPHVFLRNVSRRTLFGTFSDFQHRFTTGEDLARLLWGVKRVLEEFGSLEACFVSGLKEDHDTVLPALSSFAGHLRGVSKGRVNSLLPFPERGGASKRLNLFLRWMVRRDEVDPGGWEEVPRTKLIVPLDTHMHRIGCFLGWTARRQADSLTACQITEAFRAVSPDDPVRYDFVLTRLGIRKDLSIQDWIKPF